jgi:hypothetical protein
MRRPPAVLDPLIVGVLAAALSLAVQAAHHSGTTRPRPFRPHTVDLCLSYGRC